MQLAEKIGVNNSTVSRWEQGERMQSHLDFLDAVRRVAELSGTPVQQLLYGEHRGVPLDDPFFGRVVAIAYAIEAGYHPDAIEKVRTHERSGKDPGARYWLEFIVREDEKLQ